MKILVTGAKGFVGKNLCAQLNNIKDGKARCYGDLKIDEVLSTILTLCPNSLTHGVRSVTSFLIWQVSTVPKITTSS